ncbi:MAG: DUF3192 domain-containing protein [Gammaproteobacteria bacterium]|nr:DUF3192 domain-containing protein [Gammaproteobacteria bacterium]MDP6673571.1 DUF3192 domain-containing protein [Gammaproteobacteria bacterium]
MRNAFFSALVGSTLFGCTLGLGPFIAENRHNLEQLQYGMTKEQVHAVMGQKTVRQQYSNPFRTAMHLDENNESIEIFYYWTDGSGMDGIQEDELTPVIFRSGQVIGWGREFFNQRIEQAPVASQPTPVKQEESVKNNNQVSKSPVTDTEISSDEEEFWVTDPGAGKDQSSGIPMYPRSSCIGAVVMGVCKGEILHLGPVPKHCYGEMLNGKCTGKAY